jgi:3-isopropylmalate/(R)-2-methylmalate dehydratase small subunit
MHPINNITSHYFAFSADNVDTDQIIPARFLKVTDKEGLGALAFHDRRYAADGSPDPKFPINAPAAAGAEILVAGHNFGCGSSREHAPWALLGAGVRAVISSGFADIFRNNALKNGLLPVTVPPVTLRRLIQAWEQLVACGDERTDSLTIDVSSQTLTIDATTSINFPLGAFEKYCLLAGVDQLDFLLGATDDIDAFEAAS